MFSSIIISGAQAQDHEFIYPYYRLLEANSKLDVCLLGGKPVKGILGNIVDSEINISASEKFTTYTYYDDTEKGNHQTVLQSSLLFILPEKTTPAVVEPNDPPLEVT